MGYATTSWRLTLTLSGFWRCCINKEDASSLQLSYLISHAGMLTAYRCKQLLGCRPSPWPSRHEGNIGLEIHFVAFFVCLRLSRKSRVSVLKLINIDVVSTLRHE